MYHDDEQYPHLDDIEQEENDEVVLEHTRLVMLSEGLSEWQGFPASAACGICGRRRGYHQHAATSTTAKVCPDCDHIKPKRNWI